jgi:hypothetical protein
MFKSHVYQQYDKQIQYLISLEAKILQNDHWVRKITIMQRQNLSVDGASTGATRGEVGLASFILVLLVPLIRLQHLVQSKAMIEVSLSRLMVATQQVGENKTCRLSTRMAKVGFD